MDSTDKREINSKLCSFKDIFGSEWNYTEYKENNQNEIKTVKLKKIVIPMIQRDYAQGRNVDNIIDIRNAFLDTLLESAIENKEIILDFVYGNIDSKGVMTPLDGQQRLTTLFLLHWYASRFSRKPDSNSEDCEFLKCFSYETRASARIFCEEICKYFPDSISKGKLSEEIADQTWFLLQWKDDVTISSMLVMLDAIHEKFSNVKNLWDNLSNGIIKFYFLPIKDMGLTDELYIRMNSRGKPLTDFEHFKAELEKCISQVYNDKEKTNEIMRKIDLTWTNMLWAYCEKDFENAGSAIIDNGFLNFFYFVCDIIYYKAAYKNNIPYTKNMKELKLLSKYFSSSNSNAQENIKTLVSFFDCWCDIETIFEGKYKTPKELQESFLSSNHQPEKVIASTDILKNCLKASRKFNDGKAESSFTLGDTIRLYAITLYLLNNDKLSENQFIRRFRSVNNLILNSGNEIADRELGSNMSGIIKQTEELILNGKIDNTITGFNTHQVKEEIEKIKFTEDYPDKAELLFELEDHQLLKGQIGIIGLDHIDYTKRFESLFECNSSLVNLALMSVGDYGQQIKNAYYQYATDDIGSWVYMFHIRNDNKQSIENTSEILLKLLSKHENFDNSKLEKICEDFIKFCEDAKEYSWRYYYVKYHNTFRHYSDTNGRYYKESNGQYDYIKIPKSQISPKSYNPFLYTVYKDHDKLWSPSYYQKGYNFFIEYENFYITCNNKGYSIYYNNKVIDKTVPQNKNGIDTVNRILFLDDIIREINDAVKNNDVNSYLNNNLPTNS